METLLYIGKFICAIICCLAAAAVVGKMIDVWLKK
jgi:hypothetical protein